MGSGANRFLDLRLKKKSVETGEARSQSRSVGPSKAWSRSHRSQQGPVSQKKKRNSVIRAEHRNGTASWGKRGPKKMDLLPQKKKRGKNFVEEDLRRLTARGVSCCTVAFAKERSSRSREGPQKTGVFTS